MFYVLFAGLGLGTTDLDYKSAIALHGCINYTSLMKL